MPTETKVIRHLCDHCQRPFGERVKAVKHELHCRKNPGRLPHKGERPAEHGWTEQDAAASRPWKTKARR